MKTLDPIFHKERTRAASPGLEVVISGLPALRLAVKEARELLESHGIKFRMRYLRYPEGISQAFPVDVLRFAHWRVDPRGGIAILQVSCPGIPRFQILTTCDRRDVFSRSIAWKKAFQFLERSGSLAIMFEVLHNPKVSAEI